MLVVPGRSKQHLKAVEALRAELEEEEQALDGSDASADGQQAEINSVGDSDSDLAEPDQQEQDAPVSAALDYEPDEQPSQQASPLCKLPGSCMLPTPSQGKMKRIWKRELTSRSQIIIVQTSIIVASEDCCI